MKIGYLVPEFPTQTHIFFWREIRQLRLMGEEVYIVSTKVPLTVARHGFVPNALAETKYLFPPSFKNLLRVFGNLPQVAMGLAYLKKVESIGWREHVINLGLFISAISLVQWSKASRIDHIHCHSCANAALVVAMARRMGGPPFSLTLHGDLVVYGRNQKQKMQYAQFVCAVGSHLCQQIFEQVSFPKERTFLSWMGLATSELAELGMQREFVINKLRIATVARLHPNKGHLHALEAIHYARQSGLDISYTIAGDGPFKKDIVARIEELGLTPWVTLTGTLGESEVFELLSVSDAFLLPSTGSGEAWPVGIMEAMSAGLPVISSRIGATAEMIRSGVDGILVPQADQRAILEAIELLASNLEVRRSIGAAARASAQIRFDVSASANHLVQAIARSKGI